MDQADTSPRFIFVKTVERMTRAHASFAAGAGIEIDGECVLLPFARLFKRNQIAVVARLRWNAVFIMLPRESLDGSEALLLIEQVVDQRLRAVPIRQCGHA